MRTLDWTCGIPGCPERGRNEIPPDCRRHKVEMYQGSSPDDPRVRAMMKSSIPEYEWFCGIPGCKEKVRGEVPVDCRKHEVQMDRGRQL